MGDFEVCSFPGELTADIVVCSLLGEPTGDCAGGDVLLSMAEKIKSIPGWKAKSGEPLWWAPIHSYTIDKWGFSRSALDRGADRPLSVQGGSTGAADRLRPAAPWRGRIGWGILEEAGIVVTM